MATRALAISSSASSSSSSTVRFKYEVFLSFRGEDTRKNFTDHLYNGLVQYGVHTFRDDEELDKGDEISRKLPEAIEQSEISIIVFSRNFASSTWCLRELVKILECRKDPIRQTVLPIFLEGADPSVVRNQAGSFGEALRTHEAEFGSEVVNSWKEALREAAGLVGWDQKSVDDGYESKLIGKVVGRVLSIIKPIHEDVAKYPVGIDSHVEDMMGHLNKHAMVGICGMGGIGKTTIAKAVYYKICKTFQGSSILEGVREASEERKGLIKLQRQLLFDILRKKIQLSNVNEGKALIERRFRALKVLIILDDVDKIGQVEALAGGIDWFGLGSKVIITTRDEHVLNLHQVNGIYKPKELEFNQSLQLFSNNAFRRDQPLDCFMKLAENIVCTIGGLPLALEVLGCFLFDKERPKEWESTLEKLKKIPPKEIQEKLKISYESLDDLEKDLFLHIACFFIGTEMEYANDILESCELCSTIGMKVLIQKSLLKIDNKNKIRIHDLLRDMGRKIVRKESPYEPGKRSRLWSHEEVLHVLKECTGTSNVKGLLLKVDQRKENVSEEHHFSAKAFTALTNLRLLHLDDVHLVGDFNDHLSELRWLRWRCPLDLLPFNFHPKKLTVFDLSHSKIRLWDVCHQNKFSALKVLNLSWCRFLTRAPHFSGFPNLEKLDLKYCVELVEVHESIGNLEKLVHLDLSYCENIVELPSSICKLGSLQNLLLSHCSKLTKLPEQLGSMVSSIDLASGTTIEKIPKSIELITLEACPLIGKIPQWIGSATNLTNLSLGETILIELPDGIGLLENLVKLSVSKCRNLVKLPESMRKMKSLKFLNMQGTNIVKLPKDFEKLSSLEELDMTNCQQLKSLPENFGNLVKLRDLCLRRSGIIKLPEDFGHLLSLQRLNMHSCENLKCLPENFGNLVNLKCVSLERSGIVKLPEDFGHLSNLQDLFISYCENLKCLPENFGNLKQLGYLSMSGSGIVKLPKDFGQLSSLFWLTMDFCQNLKSLSKSFGNLVKLDSLSMLESGISKLPDNFLRLSSLMTLSVSDYHELECLPDNYDNLVRLNSLYMEKAGIVKLPKYFERLSNFERLVIGCCQKMESLLENVGNLAQLKALCIRNVSEGAIPSDIEKLSSLEELELSGYNFCSLPASIGDLSILRRLILCNCTNLRVLPKLASSLIVLDAANCKSLERIQDMSNLNNLRRLILNNCTKLQALPDLPSSLDHLDVTNCLRLPDVSKLKNLVWLFFSNSTKLQSFPDCVDSAQPDVTKCMSNSLSPMQVLVQQGKFEHLRHLCFPGSNIPDCFIPGLFNGDGRGISFRWEIPASTAEEAQPGVLNPDIQIVDLISCFVLSLKGVRGDASSFQLLPRIIVYRNDKLIYQEDFEINCYITDEDHHLIYLFSIPKSYFLQHHVNRGDQFKVFLDFLWMRKGKMEVKKVGLYLVYNSNEDSTTMLKSTYERVADFFTCSCGASVGDGISANKELVDRSAIDFPVSSGTVEGKVDRLQIGRSRANVPNNDDVVDMSLVKVGDPILTQTALDSLNATFADMSLVKVDDGDVVPPKQKKRKKSLVDADDVVPKPKKPKKIPCST